MDLLQYQVASELILRELFRKSPCVSSAWSLWSSKDSCHWNKADELRHLSRPRNLLDLFLPKPISGSPFFQNYYSAEKKRPDQRRVKKRKKKGVGFSSQCLEHNQVNSFTWGLLRDVPLHIQIGLHLTQLPPNYLRDYSPRVKNLKRRCHGRPWES